MTTGERPDSTIERELLRCCARVVLDQRSAARLRTLLDGQRRPGGAVLWRALLDEAAAHGLTPLVARHLVSRNDGRSALDERVPHEVRRELQARAMTIAARNLMLARELAAVVDVLDAAGVPCLPFKGPLVAVDVYGDLALRSFGDLDVVVPRRVLLTARRALVAASYRSPYGLSEVQEMAILRAHGHLTLVRDGAEAPVELHWRFAPDCFPSLDVEDALTRARGVRLAGRDIPSLAPEDLLVTLCVHGGKHVWFSLEWVCGVAELLRRGDVDVNAAFRLASDLGCTRLLRLGLRVAHELVEAPLPAHVAAAVTGDATTTRLATAVYASLFAAHAPAGASGPLEHLGYQLRAQESGARRLRYLHHVTMLPTPAEWSGMRLPDWLVPAYRIVRPLRLTAKYLRRPLQP